MSVLRKYDINTIINEGFEVETKGHDKEALNYVVNSFLPIMKEIISAFKNDHRTKMNHEELLSYAYIATAAAVMEYTVNDGEFSEYVASYIIDSLKDVTNVKLIAIPLEKVVNNLVCNNDKCNGLSGNCLDKNCLAKNLNENKEKEDLLVKAKELLTTLNKKQSKTLAPIINGEIEDPKDFTARQQKTLIKLRKKL